MFSDKLIGEIKKKKTYLCLGLDPNVEKIPQELLSSNKTKEKDEVQAICNAIYEFNCGLIDSCAEYAACVKPQSAFYEVYGHKGVEAFDKTVKYAHKNGLQVVADAKRNDIASTAGAYAKAFFEMYKCDCLTVTPYLGSDGITPFTDYKERGIFVLLKTSNPSGDEIQKLSVDGEPLYLKLADLINKWGESSIGESGFSNVGAVVGATFPEEAKAVRERMPHTIFLVPGFGAQGGDPAKLNAFFNSDKQGAIINSSRDINYAYIKHGGDFKSAAAKRAMETRDEINRVLGV
jgi:orotidine-5'-phosphate decarboxylase